MAEKRSVDPLVPRLIAVQELYGVNDSTFARSVLQMTPGTWSRLKSGQRQGGGKFTRRAFAVLADPASFLPSNVPVVANHRKTA